MQTSCLQREVNWKVPAATSVSWSPSNQSTCIHQWGVALWKCTQTIRDMESIPKIANQDSAVNYIHLNVHNSLLNAPSRSLLCWNHEIKWKTSCCKSSICRNCPWAIQVDYYWDLGASREWWIFSACNFKKSLQCPVSYTSLGKLSTFLLP